MSIPTIVPSYDTLIKLQNPFNVNRKRFYIKSYESDAKITILILFLLESLSDRSDETKDKSEYNY